MHSIITSKKAITSHTPHVDCDDEQAAGRQASVMLEKHLLASHRLMLDASRSPTSSPFPVEPRVERQTIFHIHEHAHEHDCQTRFQVCRSSNTHGVRIWMHAP